MTLYKKKGWFNGERVIHIEPAMQRRVGDSFLRRPYLYTGRALTDTTLIRATQHRIRHLMLFGRQLSAGVIHGLELTHYSKTAAAEDTGPVAEQWLRITEGLGLTAYGDDITLSRTTDILFENVETAGSEDPPRGAGIFVLEPIEIFDEAAVDDQSQCPWDKERDPLEDEQIIDSCRLVFYPWPAELGPIPAAAAGSFRNQLAYQVFDREMSHPDDMLPWEDTGIALGLTYVAADGRIAFIDRPAVVRQGGAPLSVQPMLMVNGTPRLWEARIQQLNQHLYDIKAQDPEIPAAKDYFEVLPPAGFLPKQLLDFNAMRTGFFPSQFVVNAVPIPEEQLEAALNASAGLSPFDLHKPEKIKLLVPVPQAVYEPDLLKNEVPDPIFLETLRKLIHQIRLQIAERTFLRNQAGRVIGAIDYGDIPEFESEDPDEIPDEKKFPVSLQPDPATTDFGQLALDVIGNLREWLEENTSIYWKDYQAIDPDNVGDSSFGGLEEYIQVLSKNIQITEEYVSANYVKTEAEIYRLRQLMLGNVKASRLATSPAMGKVVEGQTRAPTVQDVENYFERIAAEAGQAAAEKLVLDAKDIRVEKMVPMEITGKPEEEKITDAMAVLKKAETGEKLKIDDVYFAARTFAGILAERMGDGSKAISMLAQPDKVDTVLDGRRALYEAVPSYMKIAYKEPATYFTTKGVLRDKKIIERVYESPAMEIKKKAVAAKAEIFGSLRRIPLQIIDKVTVAPADTAVFYGVEYDNFTAPFQDDYRKEVLENRTRKPVNIPVNRNQYIALVISPLSDSEKGILAENGVTAQQIAALEKALKQCQGRNKISLKSAVLSKNIREGIFDPNPTDGDEASYFSVGVTALEHALEAMRVVDQKLDEYRNAIKTCQTALNDLMRNSKQWQDALSQIKDKLAELRHDALVTRSLFEEEKARIAAINARRLGILTEFVNVLAYVRPRLVEARRDVPAIKLQGVYVSPVAACLAEDYEATDELADMLDLFREVPIAWLKRAAPLLERVISVTHFVDIFRYAENRARRYIPLQARAAEVSGKSYNTKEFGQAVNKVVYAHQQTKKQFNLAKTAIDVRRLSAMTWLALKQKAQDELSLADLIETGRGRSALAGTATAILEDIEDIAVCLYNRCNELTPAIRLQWANTLSIFDAPVKLQYLETLPAWDKIEPFMRRDLQNMVDWLFQQVDPKIPKALELVNDLVRVCILLASHAPVSTLIRGHVPAPAKGRSGDVIDLVVDSGNIKIGMTATVFSQNKVAVQGLVADISQGTARIKVTQIPAKTGEYSVDQGSQVKFYNSAVASQRMKIIP
jgi:hypothetical protein